MRGEACDFTIGNIKTWSARIDEVFRWIIAHDKWQWGQAIL
jgi:hypothetical protein